MLRAGAAKKLVEKSPGCADSALRYRLSQNLFASVWFTFAIVSPMRRCAPKTRGSVLSMS
jgi:hypothetical protein